MYACLNKQRGKLPCHNGQNDYFIYYDKIYNEYCCSTNTNQTKTDV